MVTQFSVANFPIKHQSILRFLKIDYHDTNTPLIRKNIQTAQLQCIAQKLDFLVFYLIKMIIFCIFVVGSYTVLSENALSDLDFPLLISYVVQVIEVSVHMNLEQWALYLKTCSIVDLPSIIKKYALPGNRTRIAQVKGGNLSNEPIRLRGRRRA